MANRQINRELRFGRWSGVVSALRIVIVSGLITFVTLSVFTFALGGFLLHAVHCYHEVMHCSHAVLHCRVPDFLCYLSPGLIRELPVARYRVDWHRGSRFRGWDGWAFRGCLVDCGYRGRVCSPWAGYLQLIAFGSIAFIWVACLFDWRLVVGYRELSSLTSESPSAEAFTGSCSLSPPSLGRFFSSLRCCPNGLSFPVPIYPVHLS